MLRIMIMMNCAFYEAEPTDDKEPKPLEKHRKGRSCSSQRNQFSIQPILLNIFLVHWHLNK
jgi:hypothetical protein